MTDRLRAGTSTLRISAALLFALVPCLVVAEASPVAAAARPAAGQPCSTSGLQFSEEHGGATYSDEVTALRARIASCTTARSVATEVAQDLLQEVKVPRRIEGLKVTLKKPCTGCTPDTGVTARSGKKLVTFTVEGGA
jgi:hypothetical protein